MVKGYRYVNNVERLVLGQTEKNYFFCVGEYAEYGFDQQRLIWYVCRLWDMAVCSDEGLTLETSAKNHIPQATNIPYQPLLIKSDHM